MTLAIVIIGFLYLFTIGLLLVGMMQLPEFISEEKEVKTNFSIIIPFRNEAAHLPALLESLKSLNYPREHFELLLVDDASEDDSAAIITALLKSETKLQFQIISNVRRSNSPKKDAITCAIENSIYDWILTTDADCQVPEFWLREYDAYIQTYSPKCIAGPVALTSGDTFIQRYQQLDNWSLQGVAVGSFGLNAPLLCNGANLAYRKDAFQQVGGFSGNDHIASGDDVFILEKMKRAFPKKVQFMKSEKAIVRTQGVNSWKQVLSQRIRWASKTSAQKNLKSIGLGFIVFFANLLLIVGFFLCFFKPELAPYYASFLAAKLLIDYISLSKTATFFNEKIVLFTFLRSALIYPLITLYVVLGSFTGMYQWKGRLHKKRVN